MPGQAWSQGSFTKLKPLRKPSCMLLVQELSLKKPFLYIKSEMEESDGDDKFYFV